MLEFKKYLKEIKKDYTPEEILIFKKQLNENNEKISLLQEEISVLETKKQTFLKENNKIQDILN